MKLNWIRICLLLVVGLCLLDVLVSARRPGRGRGGNGRGGNGRNGNGHNGGGQNGNGQDRGNNSGHRGRGRPRANGQQGGEVVVHEGDHGSERKPDPFCSCVEDTCSTLHPPEGEEEKLICEFHQDNGCMVCKRKVSSGEDEITRGCTSSSLAAELQKKNTEVTDVENGESGDAAASGSGSGNVAASGSGSGGAAASGSGSGNVAASGSGSGGAAASGSGSGDAAVSGSGSGGAAASGSGSGDAAVSGSGSGGAAASGAGSAAEGATSSGDHRKGQIGGGRAPCNKCTVLHLDGPETDIPRRSLAQGVDGDQCRSFFQISKDQECEIMVAEVDECVTDEQDGDGDKTPDDGDNIIVV